MNINLDTDYRKNYLEERYPGLSQKDAAIALSCEDEGTVTRFLNKLKYEGNCIIYTGQLNRGYGYFYVTVATGLRQVAVKAHRFSYAVHYGFDNLPTGKKRSGFEDYVLNHICHNRACVNPLHLEVITQRENMSLDKLKPR
jgi:hypothetical protein